MSVDFANTAPNRRGGGLEHWNDLVGFLLAARLIDRDRSIRLEQLEKDSPEGTQEVVRAALELRDSLRSAFEAIATRKRLDPLWVDPINRILRLTDGHEELLEVSSTARNSARWQLQFVAREQRLEWLLAAIARSAAEIISEGPEAPVRICANPQCGLFFYDASRTGKRRWCSMAVCGNRHKVAQHARRAAVASSGRKGR
ncbi:MAG TPA: CGNR zinc finger domain-containing protein [Candidatus Acidoferrales bacterium]|nr:CGNR zinc finger domain-containing protein [Candidatus Acidoferrales bacterium]